MPRVPFNRPYVVGEELANIKLALERGHLAGDAEFTKLCQGWLERQLRAPRALLTHSCTGALELAARLLELQPGDEVLMPSYTFVSTASAIALTGATPVFVDVRADTLNLDERRLADAVTPRTRAIVVVHYAGVACEMDAVLDVAARHRLAVIEDDAQGLMSTYKGRPLGTFGTVAAISFHETKNVVCGEGGALVVNEASLAKRAEILWQKGTNRQAFLRGEVDKYTWVDLGSSFLPSEITAAVLWTQLQCARELTERRLELWRRYHDAFAVAEQQGLVRRPVVPAHCGHNAHMYYLLVDSLETRTRVLARLRERGLHAVFHYVPLHSSPAGRRYGRVHGSMEVTEMAGERLLRLPLWVGLPTEGQRAVVATVLETLSARS